MEIFSRDYLLNAFMQDSDIIKNMLVRFIERSAGQLDVLPAMLQQENWEEIFRIVHTIRGTAKTLSGIELGNTAAKLEEICKTKNVPEAEKILPQLKEAFIRFKKAAEDSFLV